MMKCNKERGFNYKGMHYLDLVASNIQKGGTILDISFITQENGLVTVHIATSYAEDLTKIVDKLTYKDELLITWELVTSYKSHIIFSREILDNYLIPDNKNRELENAYTL
ncbi:MULTISPECIES: hypothetical protein [unclassified Bacillus (in: firmicutes)]|uniref:hypothetical protein n=1 Tax=unclassified Bacillus (in: firmicutes) TaxID=185979 RepID=UPI0008E3FFE7|nr:MULTISPECIES: hypothetical protein [unclassified Bacillus (in: firmicutes)]SFI03201.1 hypothetical protein SAMN04488574_101330 [Bacillus sp. 71mf]SFS81186.1 hypothetical protein SAMN04488145_103447 [Bacillus sp. 103mf]